MPIIESVHSAREREVFIKFPWKIYGNDTPWVPPTIAQQKRELDPKRGQFFKDSKAEFFVAREGREVVGRIAAIRNERHLKVHQDDVGFFGFFECINDDAVAGQLLSAAEHWLVEEHLSVSRGPADFSIFDPAGVTVFGHDVRPGFGMAYTPEYYSRLLENNGYRKARDLHAYHLDRSQLNPKLLDLQKNMEAIDLSAVNVRFLELKDLENESMIFSRIFSAAWKDNWGSLPLDPEDFRHSAGELWAFLDPRLSYVAEVEAEPVGIFLAIPDPWEILQHTKGKMGIAALLKVFMRRKKIAHYRVIMMGILPEFQKGVVGPLIIKKFYEQWHHFPYMRTIEFSWVLEDNIPTLDLLQTCGAERRQTFRIYDKFI
ncbi:MAG: hypothetical protein ACI9R3_004692 [Verrucomicrobiales bacterium]|jgi:hypothetical protein